MKHFVLGIRASILPVLCSCSVAVCSAMSAPAEQQLYQHVSSSVVHIAAGNALFGGATGTGVCLDAPCRHVLTNYHVARVLGKRMRVEGVRVAELVEATGPQDEGARTVELAATEKSKALRFNPGRDLALLTLMEPLPPSFTAVSVARYQPSAGQPVAKVTHNHKAFDNVSGAIVSLELELRSDPVKGSNAVRLPGYLLMDFPSRPGNSGGMICDLDGSLLGIIGMGIQNTDGRIVQTMAIPASVIGHFLKEHNIGLWNRLFVSETVPSIAAGAQPVTAGANELSMDDLRPDSAGAQSIRGGLVKDSQLIAALKNRAMLNMEALSHMVGEQTITRWGEDTKKTTNRYEVALYGNRETFRSIDANGAAGKELPAIPLPRKGVSPGTEWYELLRSLIAAPVEYRGTGKYQGQPILVYGFTAKSSDQVCSWTERDPHAGVVRIAWQGYVGCSWQIIADSQFNTLSIHRELFPEKGRLAVAVKMDVRYSLRSLSGSTALLPVSLDLACQFRNGRWYFASGVWHNYRQFRAESTLQL